MDNIKEAECVHLYRYWVIMDNIKRRECIDLYRYWVIKDNIKDKESIHLHTYLGIMDNIKDREQVLLFINGFERDSNAATTFDLVADDIWHCLGEGTLTPKMLLPVPLKRRVCLSCSLGTPVDITKAWP